MLDPKLKTLLTLASVPHYTKAAELLSLTQPAVTHHIKQLQDEYGIKIFNKNGRGIELSAEGEILLNHAKRVNALENALLQKFDEMRRNIRYFTVGVTSTVGEYMLPKLFSSYCKQNPNVMINIFTGDADSILRKLDRFEIDWAIVGGAVPLALNRILLDYDELCIVVSPMHRFAGRSSVELQDLKGENLIYYYSNATTRRIFEEYLVSHSFSMRDFHIVVESDNITTIKSFAAANIGISVVSRAACIKEVAEGKLITVPVKDMKMMREINIAFRKDFPHRSMLEDMKLLYDSEVRARNITD